MRFLLAPIVLLAAVAALMLAPLGAQEKKAGKEVTLQGKILCGKCELGVDAACNTAIQVKDAKTKKDVVYYFDAKGHAKFHDEICAAPKKGSVTGVVGVAGAKNTITVKDVKFE